MTICEFARRLGVSHVAVSKAVASGALGSAVRWVQRGQRKRKVADIDADAGVRAWLARPGSRAPGLTRGTEAQHPPARRRAGGDADQPAPPPPDGIEREMESFSSARLRFEAARAQREELHLAQERGSLIEVSEAMTIFARQIAAAQSAIMALGKHARSRIPHLSVDDVVVIEALCREALQGLAAGAIGTADQPPELKIVPTTQ